MYKYISAAAFLFLLTGCQNKPKEDLNKFITDKIWIDTRNEGQYYYTSEGERYLWMVAIRNGEFQPAKGTPETHKYNPALEGWLLMGDYKIVGDTLITQDKKDFKGENINKIPIGHSKDTTIGAVNYYALRAYPETINTKWISRK